MHTNDTIWAKSYALQALSDLNAREALIIARVEKCHRLHFLQMAAEKACKSYLTANNGHDQVRKTHAYIARVLPILARAFFARANDGNEIASWELFEIRKLSLEIEVLAPACDDGETRQDNTEYPWLDAQGTIRVPCEWSFSGLDDHSRSIVRLVKLIRTASEDFARSI